MGFLCLVSTYRNCRGIRRASCAPCCRRTTEWLLEHVRSFSVVLGSESKREAYRVFPDSGTAHYAVLLVTALAYQLMANSMRHAGPCRGEDIGRPSVPPPKPPGCGRSDMSSFVPPLSPGHQFGGVLSAPALIT